MTQHADFPRRFTVCTYNIWTDTRWPERREALMRFADVHRPDIFCVQELQPDSKLALDSVLLSTHERVEDTFEGWSHEGNIYWSKRLFTSLEYGAVDIEILEPLRRLFWVRLAVNNGLDQTLFVSTAHFTYNGHPKAVESEIYVRLSQARAAVASLNQLQRDNEPQLFMGDLNDQSEAIKILWAGGLTDSFKALERSPQVTHPAAPTAKGSPSSIDWMMHRGSLRVMTTEVVDFFLDDLAPSDHKPILTTYSFE
jgi:endonuclease/exonuclease/phosphatase family metal-dependent hydrolase